MNNFQTNKGVKRKKANENVIDPKDEKIKQLGHIEMEKKAFNMAASTNTFMNWSQYSMAVKKIMAEKYNYNFFRQWSTDRENILHGMWEKKVQVEVAAKTIV